MRIHALATFLDQQGFRKGDVALIAAPNSWQFLVVFLAVASRGGALSAASFLFTECEW